MNTQRGINSKSRARSGLRLTLASITILLGSAYPAKAGNSLNPAEFFVRCYHKFTGLPVPLSHPLLLGLKDQNQNPTLPQAIHACMQLLESASLNPQTGDLAYLTNPQGEFRREDSMRVLEHFERQYRDFMGANDVLNVVPGEPHPWRTTHDFIDRNEMSLRLAMMTFGSTSTIILDTYRIDTGNPVFKPGIDIRNWLRGFKTVEGIRSFAANFAPDGTPQTPIMQGPSSFVYPGKGLLLNPPWIDNTDCMQASIAQNNREPTVARFYNFCGGSPVMTNLGNFLGRPLNKMPLLGGGPGQVGNLTDIMVQSGRLTGIREIEHHSTKGRFKIYSQYAPSVDAPNKWDFPIAQSYGGGALGTLTNLFMGAPGGYKNRRFAERMFSLVFDLSLPVIHSKDARTQPFDWIPAGQQPFSNSRACMQCHTSLDPAARTVLGFKLLFPYEHGADASSLGPLLVGELDASRTGAPTPAVGEETFWQAPTQGAAVIYRDYQGELKELPVFGNSHKEGLNHLGQVVSDTDDYFISLAKRVLQMLTGVQATVRDISPGSNQPRLSLQELAYRNLVIKWGLCLKRHKKISLLIEDILKSEIFKTHDYIPTNEEINTESENYQCSV